MISTHPFLGGEVIVTGPRELPNCEGLRPQGYTEAPATSPGLIGRSHFGHSSTVTAHATL